MGGSHFLKFPLLFTLKTHLWMFTSMCVCVCVCIFESLCLCVGLSIITNFAQVYAEYSFSVYTVFVYVWARVWLCAIECFGSDIVSCTYVTVYVHHIDWFFFFLNMSLWMIFYFCEKCLKNKIKKQKKTYILYWNKVNFVRNNRHICLKKI